MNKKKFISTGVFAAVMVIGGGVAYYCYPSAINNALGINSAGSGVDILADNASSSSLAANDLDANGDDAASSASGAGIGVAAPSASAAKKSVQKAQSGAAAASAPASSASGDVSDSNSSSDSDGADAQALISPSSSSASTPAPASTPVASCAFPAGASSSVGRKIIFNEIAWMGSLLSSTAEWMEVKNISSAAVDLSGWQVLDASGKIKISFTDADGTLAPGGLLLLSRESATSADAVGTTKAYSGNLANTGGTLALMDAQCDVSDYLDASGGWPAGNNATKQTMERDADGVGWHTSAQPGGTPGAENSATPAPISTPAPAVTTTTSPSPAQASTPTSAQTQPSTPVQTISPTVAAQDENATTSSDTSMPTSSSNDDAGTATSTDATSISAPTATSSSASVSPSASASSHVLIAAVQIAGVAASNDLVKLYNPTGAPVDMSGWKLHKKSGTGADYSLKVFPSGGVIAAGQYFVWANSEDGFSETVGANVSSTETLSADNSVALMDAAGNIVDAVAWGTGTNQYGEGPPYPTSPGANQMLSRRSSDGVMVDTGDNSNDFALQ